MLMNLPVHIEAAVPRLANAIEIAMQYDRAVYDALFVALAVDVGASAVTADVPLVNALGSMYPQIKLLRDWP
jgi:predicted nucleic acid-binding protein